MSKDTQTTKVCKFCKTEIPGDAKICPNCRKKQRGVLPIVIAVVIIVVIIAALANGGSSNERGTDSEPKKSSSSSDQQGAGADTQAEVDDSTKTDAVTDTEEETAGQTVFVVGDVVETSNLNITFVSAQPYTSDNQFLQPAEGNEYYCMEFEFENVGESDQSISVYEFNCYADGYAAKASYLETDNMSATLSSGKKAKIVAYYEVPSDAQEILLEYETNFWTEDKVEFKVK